MVPVAFLGKLDALQTPCFLSPEIKRKFMTESRRKAAWSARFGKRRGIRPRATGAPDGGYAFSNKRRGMRRAWIEVDSGALLENARRLRALHPAATRFIPMIKADGYGLGAPAVARALESEDPYAFGVACVREGVELRDAGIKRCIMIYSPLAPDELERALRLGFVPAISGRAGLSVVSRTAKKGRRGAGFQIEVDTGMGRSGFALQGLRERRASILKALESGARLEGVFTHLHSADEPFLDAARSQTRLFQEALKLLEPVLQAAARRQRPLIHFANSAAALRLPAGCANAIRPGIRLFGGAAGARDPAARPVVSLRARASLVRKARRGATLGYGATYRASGPEEWATLSIGYGDGYPRALGNRGQALVRARDGGGAIRAPIVGRVSMDVTVIRVPEGGRVKVGDAVTLIGQYMGSVISLDETARRAGVIDYEVLTGLARRLPRVWGA